MCATCKDCGAPAYHKNPNKFPSSRCLPCQKKKQASYDKRRSNRPATSECKRCGNAFAVGRRGAVAKTCRECRDRTAHFKIDRRCPQCGVEFITNRKSKNFCSHKCATAGLRKPLVSKPCEMCGKPFWELPCRIGGRRFCSHKCFAAKGRVKPHTCVNCGGEFKRSPSRDAWQGKNKYCSSQCYLDARWGSNRPRRPSSHRDSERSSQNARFKCVRQKCKFYGVPFDPECTREAVCERDGWICQSCGIKCHEGMVVVDKRTRKIDTKSATHDHIVPLSWGAPGMGNVFENSQCLCFRCNASKGNRRGGQLRLPLSTEGTSWVNEDANRSRQSSRFCEAIQAAAS